VTSEQPVPAGPGADAGAHLASLATIAREWGRIGCLGFGGPPAHIALLRKLCVTDRQWLDAAEFEDAIAACNLLPGPASTELAILCAWRVRGRLGALAGGVAFIIPGLIVILALSALFLASTPPDLIRGLGAGADSAVAAVAVQAAWSLLVPSWKRASSGSSTGSSTGSNAGSNAGSGTGRRRARWIAYVLAGGVAAATIGSWLVLVLLGCGLAELAIRQRQRPPDAQPPDAQPPDAQPPGTQPPGTSSPPAGGGGGPAAVALPLLAKTAAGATVGAAVFGAIAWVAFKVGALSFGGGFVIIPLMQADAVGRHWMTNGQFLTAVALGQITPGPVVQTVAAVGYAAAGLPGGLLASLVAFTPSFVFILTGARYFQAFRTNEKPQRFLDGAGPAAIGAILGAACLLTAALSQPWQVAILAAAALLLLVAGRGVVLTLLCAAAAGMIIAAAGGPLPS
jgi:chromate transporter